MSKLPVRMSRVLRDGERDDGTFDLEFWQRVGAEGIFAAAWDMVNEVSGIRGGGGEQPRLQKSIVRVVRREQRSAPPVGEPGTPCPDATSS